MLQLIPKPSRRVATTADILAGRCSICVSNCVNKEAAIKSIAWINLTFKRPPPRNNDVQRAVSFGFSILFLDLLPGLHLRVCATELNDLVTKRRNKPMHKAKTTNGGIPLNNAPVEFVCLWRQRKTTKDCWEGSSVLFESKPREIKNRKMGWETAYFHQLNSSLHPILILVWNLQVHELLYLTGTYDMFSVFSSCPQPLEMLLWVDCGVWIRSRFRQLWKDIWPSHSVTSRGQLSRGGFRIYIVLGRRIKEGRESIHL